MERYDRDLGNGSIQRFDPRTGKSRIISGADAARTALTRERDAQFAMQAGAPPIAQGARPGQAPSFSNPTLAEDRQRLLSLASARPDRNITAETVARATPEQISGELSVLGTGANLASRRGLAPSAAPRVPTGSLAPSDPNNPDSPLVPDSRPAAPSAAPRQAPNFGARQDGNVTRNNYGEVINPQTGMVDVAADNADFAKSRPLYAGNMALAVGPNISSNTGLPQGSIGIQRKDGSFFVQDDKTGKAMNFASEKEARDYYAKPAAPAAAPAPAPAPAAPVSQPAAQPAPAPAVPNFMEGAQQRVGQAMQQFTAPLPAPAPQVAPAVEQAPAVIPYGDPRNPVRDVTPATPSPAVQAVVAAATQPPQPAATPTNAITFPARPGVSGGPGIIESARTNPDANRARILDTVRGVGGLFQPSNWSMEGGALTFGNTQAYARRLEDRANALESAGVPAPEYRNEAGVVSRTAKPEPVKQPVTTRASAAAQRGRRGPARPQAPQFSVPSAAEITPNRDAGSVQMPNRAPLFEDTDPAAFPTLNGSVGSSRPRASLA